MNTDARHADSADGGSAVPAYRPPMVTYLGNLADLTQKTTGAFDGQTFLGLQVSSV